MYPVCIRKTFLSSHAQSDQSSGPFSCRSMGGYYYLKHTAAASLFCLLHSVTIIPKAHIPENWQQVAVF